MATASERSCGENQSSTTCCNQGHNTTTTAQQSQQRPNTPIIQASPTKMTAIATG